ncbi:MAG: phosphopantetheine-binding protein [Gemmatimonadales bacterium]
MTPDIIGTTITDTIVRIAQISRPAVEDDIYLAGFASTDALELLVELEDSFSIVVPDDRFIDARTVSALTLLVQDALKEVA